MFKPTSICSDRLRWFSACVAKPKLPPKKTVVQCFVFVFSWCRQNQGTTEYGIKHNRARSFIPTASRHIYKGSASVVSTKLRSSVKKVYEHFARLIPNAPNETENFRQSSPTWNYDQIWRQAKEKVIPASSLSYTERLRMRPNIFGKRR